MGLSAGLCAGVVRPPKCCQATKSDILRSCPDFLSPLGLHRKSGMATMGAGYYLTGWIRHRTPTVGWNRSEKAKRSFQKIWFPLPIRGPCLKRLVKNLSKRLEQQQLLVRSLVTLTVKEWVRSQMYTLFWGFCKINNPFGKSGKNMKIFFFKADVYWSHIATCNAWFTKFAA